MRNYITKESAEGNTEMMQYLCRQKQDRNFVNEELKVSDGKDLLDFHLEKINGDKLITISDDN